MPPWYAGGRGSPPFPLRGSRGDSLQYSATSGGLTVVGSYVPCTSEQLQRLLDRAAVVPVELDVACLLAPNRRDQTVREAIAVVNHHLGESRDVVLYTSRRDIAHTGADANLETGRIISDAIVRVVQQLAVPPRYLIAKGGITSSDVATRDLGVRRLLRKCRRPRSPGGCRRRLGLRTSGRSLTLRTWSQITPCERHGASRRFPANTGG